MLSDIFTVDHFISLCLFPFPVDGNGDASMSGVPNTSSYLMPQIFLVSSVHIVS